MWISQIALKSIRKHRELLLRLQEELNQAEQTSVTVKTLQVIGSIIDSMESHCETLTEITQEAIEGRSRQLVPPEPPKETVYSFGPLLQRNSMEIRNGWRKEQKEVFTVRHSGLGIGDILMALPVAQMAGRCEFHITAKTSPFKYSPLHPYSDLEYRDKTYQALADFIAFQENVESAVYEPFDPVATYDLDFDYGRYIVPSDQRMPVNDRFFWLFDVPRPGIDQKWLRTKRESDFSTRGKILVHHSLRYPTLVDWTLLEKCKREIVFVGFEEEYEAMKSRFGDVPVEWKQYSSFFEFAQWIEDADIFIGNMSCGIVFADGLQVPRVMVREKGNGYYASYGSNSRSVLSTEEMDAALSDLGMYRQQEAIPTKIPDTRSATLEEEKPSASEGSDIRDGSRRGAVATRPRRRGAGAASKADSL